MKLRLKGNSIRLRVLRSEVQQLAQGKRVEEIVRFGTEPDACLTYAAEIGEATAHDIQVVHQASRIVVTLPPGQLKEWAEGDQVGIYGTIDLGPHGALDVAIEKDFACLDLSDAENFDTFEHPNAGIAC